jgi:hypothetical protein
VQPAPHQQQHQGILFAAHPGGGPCCCSETCRRNPSRGIDTSRLMQAAHEAVEASQRPPDPLMRGFLLQMPELASSAQPLPIHLRPAVLAVQGAGEAAPWAEMDLARSSWSKLSSCTSLVGMEPISRLGVQRSSSAQCWQRRLQQQPACLRHGSWVPGAVRPDWLTLTLVRPGLAPAMLPSVACAPAPVATLLCHTCLGLHTAPAAGLDGSIV